MKHEPKRTIMIWLGRFSAIVCAAVFFLGVGTIILKQRENRRILSFDISSSDTSQAQNTNSSDMFQTQSTNSPDTSQTQSTNSSYPVIEQEGEWNLVLVNPWHTLPETYSIRTVELIDGQSIDERCYPELQEMMDDCRAAGLSPYICSSYRTWEKQERLFEDNVVSLMAQGYSEEDARSETAKNVAIPGTSEHQLGLAVDIVDKNYQVLDEAQEGTAVQQWLMENSYKYGWILRYPADKSDITGIVYEPWHYRYVGKEAAEEIYREGICLEEYLEKNNLP